jgi:hypothetical protein
VITYAHRSTHHLELTYTHTHTKKTVFADRLTIVVRSPSRRMMISADGQRPAARAWGNLVVSQRKTRKFCQAPPTWRSDPQIHARNTATWNPLWCSPGTGRARYCTTLNWGGNNSLDSGVSGLQWWWCVWRQTSRCSFSPLCREARLEPQWTSILSCRA